MTWFPGLIFSYRLYIVGFALVKITISTNPKLTIYRNLFEKKGISSATYLVVWALGTVCLNDYLISCSFQEEMLNQNQLLGQVHPALRCCMVMPFNLIIILSSHHLYFQNIQCFILAMPLHMLIRCVITCIFSSVKNFYLCQ